MTKRPLGITILSIWAIIAGILNLTGYAGFVRISTFFDFGYPIIVISWIVDIIISTVFFITAYGLLKAFQWSWFSIIIITLLAIMVQIATIFILFYCFNIFKGVIYILILGIILFYLSKPNIKAYFGKT